MAVTMPRAPPALSRLVCERKGRTLDENSSIGDVGITTYIDFKLGSGQGGESSSQESEQSDKADVLPQRANAVDGAPRGVLAYAKHK